MDENESTIMIDNKPLIHHPVTVNRLSDIRKLPWRERLFRPMYEGSMRRLIIMWVGMCMGTGNLTLPYYFSNLGIIPAVILLILSCYLNLVMCTFINEMAVTSNSTNFYVLVERAVPTLFFVIFKYSLFVDILTTMMSISVVVWNLFEYIMFSMGVGRSHWHEWIIDVDTFQVNEYHPTIILARGVFYLLLYMLLVKLFFKKSLGPLGIFLQISVYTTLAVVIFTIIDVPFFFRGYKNEDIGVKYIKPFNLDWIKGFYGFCFCYYVQPYMLSLRNELTMPTHERVVKTMKYGFLSQAILYCLLGLCAYISLGDKYTPPILTTRKPYPNRDPYWEGIYKLITIMYFLSNTMCLASYSPTLKVCMRAFLKIKSKNKRRFVLSTFPFTVSCVLSFVYPNITSIINLCGSTLYNYNGYIIPTLMKIKLVKDSKGGFGKLLGLYIALSVFIFSLGYGMVSPILELYNSK